MAHARLELPLATHRHEHFVDSACIAHHKGPKDPPCILGQKPPEGCICMTYPPCQHTWHHHDSGTIHAGMTAWRGIAIA